MKGIKIRNISRVVQHTPSWKAYIFQMHALWFYILDCPCCWYKNLHYLNRWGKDVHMWMITFTSLAFILVHSRYATYLVTLVPYTCNTLRQHCNGGLRHENLLDEMRSQVCQLWARPHHKCCWHRHMCSQTIIITMKG